MSEAMKIGLGVGVGVGVPLLLAVIAAIVFLAIQIRKRNQLEQQNYKSGGAAQDGGARHESFRYELPEHTQDTLAHQAPQYYQAGQHHEMSGVYEEPVRNL